MNIIWQNIWFIRQSYIIILALFFVVIVLNSCKTSPSCIHKRMEGISITWGINDRSHNLIKAYKLDHFARVMAYTMENDSLIQKSEFQKVDEAMFCRTVGLIRNELIEIQALYEPGDTTNFIQYQNPNYSVNIQVVWNPRFKTEGSKKIRQAFDSLNVLIETIKE